MSNINNRLLYGLSRKDWKANILDTLEIKTAMEYLYFWLNCKYRFSPRIDMLVI